MATYHQSQLKAWAECPAKVGYEIAGLPTTQNSYKAYGSVMHAALEVLERRIASAYADYGRRSQDYWKAYEAAVQTAVEFFLWTWHPMNIETVCEPVPPDGWASGAGYSELRTKGADALRKYAEILRYDDHELLATEFAFNVPIAGTWDEDLGEPHRLAGTVDRLAVRHVKRHEYLAVDDYKALWVHTPLPTPTGWTTMGQVAVGDQLIGDDGRPCTVLGKSSVYDDRDCYRVTFDDGTWVVADGQHRWSVIRGTSKKPVVLTTSEMVEQLWSTAPRPQRQLRIDNTEPLVLPDAELPVHPYVLGAWLGDGKHSSGEISKPDDELFSHIEACGYEVGPNVSAADRCQARTVYGLVGHLRTAGVFRDKHVPEAYLRASLTQRLALLQGLMDTDGSWNKARQQAVFTTTDKGMAEAVRELATSLGAKARTWELTRKGFRLTVTCYDVTFSPIDWNPFRLSRKADLVRPAKTNARRRIVVSVEPTITVPTQCLAVDNDSHLFLCGEQMVPTHNTGAIPQALRHDLQFTSYCYASTQREFWVGDRDEDGFGLERGEQLFQRFAASARRGTWVSLRTFKFIDAGWRGPLDYKRFAIAVEQIHASRSADIFPLSISGLRCRYCEFRRGCAGVGVAPEDHGDPRALVTA